MVLLFIGPSGSGKDTQAHLLKEKHGFEVISTGELLRDVSRGNTEIQKRIVEDMNEGFSPDELVFGLLQVYLRQSNFTNFILTGAVRRISQISMLDEALQSIGKQLDKIIYFELSYEEAIERIKGRVVDERTGRIYHNEFNPPPQEMLEHVVRRTDDDVNESYVKRLEDFRRDNENILSEYHSRGNVIDIDASDSIDEIHNEIVSKLGLKT